MIDELFDPPPPPQPRAHSTKRSTAAIIDELFDPLPQLAAPTARTMSSSMESHTTGSNKSHI